MVRIVKAKLISKNDPGASFEVELKDDGINGDKAGNDNVFSKKIPQQKFGFYRVIIEATDSFDNKTIQEVPEEFLLH
jgi:hypothetical protein